jgi:hypothetical protein
MGQQQLLLIVLGVIVVGIAVAVGINMFSSGASQANFDAVVGDLQKIASDAQGWFRKPASLGGGGRSFASISLSAIGAQAANANGAYSITGSPTAATFTVQGVGVEDGDGDGTPVTVSLAIYADSTGTLSVTSR